MQEQRGENLRAVLVTACDLPILMRQCERRTETEYRVVRSRVRTSQQCDRGTKNEGRSELESSAAADQQVAVRVGGRITIELGRRAGVAPRSGAERKNAYRLRHWYRGADGSSECHGL